MQIIDYHKISYTNSVLYVTRLNYHNKSTQKNEVQPGAARVTIYVSGLTMVGQCVGAHSHTMQQ